MLPCADELSIHDNIPSEISANDQAPDHIHDLCSPLCTCHCCHSHLVNQCSLCLGIFTYFNNKPSEKPNPFLSRISFAIWDPPSII